MQNKVVVELNEDGSFTTHGCSVDCHLIYDPSLEGGAWLLLHTTNAETDHVLSAHNGLDDAINALVQSSHDDTERFSVLLPTGEVFSRPGNLTSEEILAVHGYLLLDGFTAFALYEPEVSLNEAEALRAVEEAVYGRPLVLGSVLPVGDEGVWCCDFRVPFEGYVHEDALKAIVATALSGSGLEPVELVEYDDLGVEVPAESNIVAFPKAA